MLRQRDKSVAGAPWRLFLAVGLTGILVACAGSVLPVFDTPRELAGSVLVLAPVVHLGELGVKDNSFLVEPLERSVRQALAGKGMSIVEGLSDDALASFRQALQLAWSRKRAAGDRRFKAGEELGLQELLEAPARTGARSVAFVVLSGNGEGTGSGYVPVPMGEIIPLPEERPDYVVPRTGSGGFARGVDMDLLLVDLQTSQVILHRRVSHPAQDAGELIDAITVLSRELTRGLRVVGRPN